MHVLAWSLPLVSGLADASMRGVIKLTSVHKFTLTAAGYIFALPFYAIWLAFTGVPEVQPAFWRVVVAHVPLLVLANILTVEAHRRSPLMTTAPYMSLTSAYLLGTAPLMLERMGWPNLTGGFGVAVITAGLYLLNTKGNQAGLLAPFRQLREEVGSLLMFAVGVIFSVTANLDYLAFASSNAPFYLLVDHGAVGIVSAILALVYYALGRASAEEISPAGSWRTLALYGVMLAASIVPHLLAFVWIPVVPYVIAGKRAGTILFSVGIGIVIATLKRFGGRYANEREHLKWRLPGTFLMVVGMVVIVLWGRNP